MKHIIYTLMMSVIVFASVSCSLEEDPEYFVNKDDFYKNKEQCVSAVNACYNKLNSIYTFRMLTLTDAHSDLIYEPAPTVTEARMELSPAQPGGGESIWLNCYQMIMYANSAFVGVQGSPLDDDEKKMFLEDLGLKESGLEKLIKASYHILGLISYLTAGEPEVRAWTITRGTKAPQAAGKIHTDFERGFIRAEVVSYDDLIACGSHNAAKEKGLIRLEGKDYVVQDGDIMLFRFNV